MVEFEQLTDTFENMGDTVEEGVKKGKKFIKNNKLFVIALIGVSGLALYKYFTSKGSQDMEYVSTYAYVPTAYDGYPTMSESVSYDDVVNQLRNETTDLNNDFYNETMSSVSQAIEELKYQQEQEYSNIMETVNKNADTKYDETDSYIEEQKKIINQMQSNSNAWHTASDSEKERLHDENVILGSMLGASFDDASGYWTLGGQTINVVNSTGSNSTNTTNTAQIEAQMKANSQAWHTASDSEKERLHQENVKLGAMLGASYDDASGEWSKNGTVINSGASASGSSASGSSGSGSSGSGSSGSKTYTDGVGVKWTVG